MKTTPRPPDDPNWPRSSAWLAGECAPSPAGTIAVLGAPVRLGSITPGRCDMTPAAVRAILRKFTGYDLDTGADLLDLRALDMGDLALQDAIPEEALEPLREAVAEALQAAEAVVVIGGNNAVTRPCVHGLGPSLDRCGLLTLDAHFDLRHLEDGLSNGNPIRALLADGLPGENVVQLGLLGFANSRAYADVAREAGITFRTAGYVRERGIDAAMAEALEHLSARADALFVDLDIDVLDRIYAPATPGSRPGGLMPWELRRAAWLCGAHPKVRGIDLVEVDPTEDVADTTVLTTAACLLSFASGLLDRLRAA